MSTLNVASINSGPIGGMRNALINGNPTINQRGYVSGTATTGANQYTLDRWRVVVSGQALSWTDNENTRTVTAPAGGVEQVVEGINLISGSYVLSWVGTATATVNGAPVANGSPVTLVGGVNTTVRFSGGTFALAQLEPGTRATPFERRSYGQELVLCQRYYYKILNDTGAAINPFVFQAFGPSAAFGKIADLPVPMRATPTCSTSGTFTPYTAAGALGTAFSTTPINTPSKYNLNTNGWSTPSGLAAGNATVVNMPNNAFIDASAEL